MDKVMRRFLTSIGLTDFDRYDLSFEVVTRNPFKKEQIDMVILKEEPWHYDLLSDFLNAIYNIDYPCTFRFHYRSRPTSKDGAVLFDHWYQASYRKLPEFTFSLTETSIMFDHEGEEEKVKYDDVFAAFKELLVFINYDIDIERIVHDPIVKIDEKEVSRLNKKADKTIDLDLDNPFIDNDEMHEERLIVAQDIICDELEENLKAMQEDRRVANKFKRSGQYKPAKIGYFDTKSGQVDFDGVIFSREEIETSKGRLILNLGVGFDGHGVYVKAFEDRNHLKIEKLDILREGCHIRVRGTTDSDRYNNGKLVVVAHYVDVLPPPPLPQDNSELKRVELHLHTKMSAMDGVSLISDYCRVAASMGHKALAVTDHGVVQAFPDAQIAAKKYNLKMIYGVEMYMIDDDPGYIINPSPDDLSTSTFIAFDLETTGLSIGDDHIIEFGAVKIRHGLVIATLDILINPGVPISQKTVSITNITDAMLKGQPSISEALPRIIEFIGKDMLISHNAKFDHGFLNEALITHGYAPLVNPIIDTLSLSRNIFYEASSHRLGSLARRVDVVYEEGKAHRADYDAQVLGQIWGVLNTKIQGQGISKHFEIAHLSPPDGMLKNLFPYHVIVLAKNAAGLKDLFDLISLSHTKYWADVPRIPRSEIAKHRANLIIGSACFNGELFTMASTRTVTELEDATAFYDYVEVQPKENYRWLIDMDQMDEKRLEVMLNRLINAADKAHKLVVATGDAHYSLRHEKVYRDVMISAKGLKGVNHPMSPYSREDRPQFENPDQHFRSTEEMLQAFAWLGETRRFEIVVKNTNLIADSIEAIYPVKDKLLTPIIEGSETFLRDLCTKRAREVYGEPLPVIVKDRLERELTGIIKNGYSVIYYIAHKIIKKANDDGYIVGSRGSVGSSFVATLANITEVNPLPPHYVCPSCHHSEFLDSKVVRSGFDLPPKLCPECLTPMKGDGQNIPFATFLGFEAEKVPDIDLNFPPDYQARAHDYTRFLLGEKNVYRAGTIETIAEKTAFGYAKGYFERQGIDLETVSNADIAYLAAGCQGVKRTTGQHPGGLVVIPTGYDVLDFTPVQYPADKSEDNSMTTHFDFSAIHDNVLKLDLLGHVDPQALKLLSDLTGVKIEDIPMNDPEALSLFSSSEALKRQIKNLRSLQNGALGLPEFGTPFVMEMLNQTKPKTFGELVILSGLSHGKGVWVGNAKDIINEGKGTLLEVIGCRDDIMTYLMDKGVPPKTAFAIMEDVRRGRKVKKEFENVMKACKVPSYYIDSCNKIKYMFPKAHATAYVTMAVRVAWFKVHYPLEYYASYFSLRAKQFDLETMLKSPKEILAKTDHMRMTLVDRRGHMKPKDEDIHYSLLMALEMMERGYRIQNIDLDKSDAEMFLVDYEQKALIPPFIVIDGVGLNAASSVVTARSDKPFLSRQDLLSRTKLSATNVEHLAKLNVLDHLDESNQISLFSF